MNCNTIFKRSNCIKKRKIRNTFLFEGARLNDESLRLLVQAARTPEIKKSIALQRSAIFKQKLAHKYIMKGLS
jgi:hypothetical protein